MNSEKAKYPFSISDKMTMGFMGIFSISFSGKKRMSSGFSHFGRSLSFEGLLSPLWRCFSFERLLSFGFYPFE